ncbi:MAG: hypothetical protein BGP04_15260 [Rhizobiales bacterium 62-17]|nr:MAG: hypothetical protein BGP04_15260 [Rhizobiales bacterium 62-17]
MKSIYGLAVGASLAVAAFASAPASAMPLSAGMAPSAADAHASPLTEQVQYRRYGGPRYYGGGPRYYRRGGIGPGGAIAAGAALGILGAAAAASAAPSYGYGYPAPAYGYGGGYGCYWVRRPVYDAWGNPRGTHPFQVCN